MDAKYGLGLAKRGLPAGDPLVFLLVILTDLFLFAVFVAAGICYRARGETHKCFMVVGTVSMLPPAISRWPIAASHPAPVVMRGRRRDARVTDADRVGHVPPLAPSAVDAIEQRLGQRAH